MQAIIVYSTAPNQAEAENLAQVLVEKKLAACVNVLAPSKSYYHWQGQVETAAEVPLIIKSRVKLYPQLAQTLKDTHSYSCPCIIAWQTSEVEAAYAKWLEESLL